MNKYLIQRMFIHVVVDVFQARGGVVVVWTRLALTAWPVALAIFESFTLPILWPGIRCIVNGNRGYVKEKRTGGTVRRSVMDFGFSNVHIGSASRTYILVIIRAFGARLF